MYTAEWGILKEPSGFAQIMPFMAAQFNWNEVCRDYQNHPEALNAIAQAFDERGYRKLKLYNIEKGLNDLTPITHWSERIPWMERNRIGMGASSLVFETTENQLLRLSRYAHRSKSLNHPAILQPIDSFTITTTVDGELVYYNVDIMPKVRTEGVTDDHVDQLVKALGGIDIQDLSIENVGLMDIPGHDPIPIILDSGLVKIDRTSRIDYSKLGAWLSDKKTSDHPHGIPLQKLYDPRIGTGKPSGVVDAETLSRLEDERGPDSVIVQALKKGSYGEHARRALENLTSLSRA